MKSAITFTGIHLWFTKDIEIKYVKHVLGISNPKQKAWMLKNGDV
jgi:hypothetical protein